MTIDTLTERGVEPMDDEEISQFLTSQGFGVLGLDAGTVPYILPMSFGYDGDERLYFTYVVDEDSQKERLSAEVDKAAFLVYEATAPFQWESVTLTGTIEYLTPDRWDEFQAVKSNTWRPEALQEAEADATVRVYEYHIESREGYKHAGLPEGFKESE
ncbi:pyridoxamine 5'-phosphate oxidase family protein [Salinibaculum rarum]|uniref:pyridoxamine 5'-phosphate oxidase family protein n=1 Tax=Salinibaculum rarum TaxID=3058903 RepID=UPI0026603134|nr:pyridoxamine 5'-phosphate oxidase family protein [Salinibaculum sp. KK48]